MPKMHLRQAEFTCSAFGPFPKTKEFLKFKETGDWRYIYQNKLNKSWFQHDVAFEDFKDLLRRTVFDNVLNDKPFDIAKSLKHDGYQLGIVSMVDFFFDKKPSVGAINSKIILKQSPFDLACVTKVCDGMRQLAKGLDNPIIRKFEKWKVYSSFKNNIRGDDLADMQLISKCKKGF